MTRPTRVRPHGAVWLSSRPGARYRGAIRSAPSIRIVSPFR
jgi:hypothetical protein